MVGEPIRNDLAEGSSESVASELALHGGSDWDAGFEDSLTGGPECPIEGKGLLRHRDSDEGEPDYEELSRRVLAFIAPRRDGIERARAEAPELLRRLLEQPAERRLLLLRNSPRYQTPPLVEALGLESRRRAAASVEEARELARLALEAARRVDPAIYGERLCNDLVALGHAFVANAWRVANRLAEAGKHFSRAADFLSRGSCLETVSAEVDTYKASWLMAKGDLGEARRVLSRVTAVFAESGETTEQARALVIHAFICREGGESEEACRLLAEAERLPGLQDEPRLAFSARQNRLQALADLERFDEALALLPEVQVLAERLDNHLDLLRVRWVEAKILAGTGRLYPAEAIYAQVRDEFLALDLPLDAGLAALELCLVLIRLGRTTEVGEIVGETLVAFLEQGVEREAIAACTVLARAAAAQAMTEALVLQALESLRRSRHSGLE